MPKGSPSREKNAMNTMPRMISGVMMGSMEIYSTTFLVRACIFVKPTAPSVPMTAAASEEESPSTMLFTSASNMALSLNSVSYQRSEKPPHTLDILLSLNEYTTTSTIGR